MGAPRLPARPWRRLVRGGLLALALVAPVLAHAEGVVSACYVDPDRSYGHLVLGLDYNWGAVSLETSEGRTLGVLPPEGLVFEDVAPHLADVDGDGFDELLVIESGPGKGARLAIYALRGDGVALLAATPHIGRSNRWYAQAGAADLDGDGTIEVVFVDRPHLAKVLRVWRFDPDTTPRFSEIAVLEGLTNHRIGEDFITGGIRQCGGPPEIILASGDRAHVEAVTLMEGRLMRRRIGPATGRASFEKALICD